MDTSVFDSAVQMLVAHLGRIAANVVTRAEDASAEALYRLLIGHPRTAQPVADLSHAPDDLRRQNDLTAAMVAAGQDEPAFTDAVSRYVDQSRQTQVSGSPVTQSIHGGAGQQGDAFIGIKVNGNRNHIGDKIINKIRTSRGAQVGVVVVGLAVVVIVVLLLANSMGGTQKAPGGAAVQPAADTELGGQAAPIAPPSTTAPPPSKLKPGDIVYTAQIDDVVEANGHVLVVQQRTRDFSMPNNTTFTTIDLTTGQRLGQFSIQAVQFGTTTFPTKCDYQVVRRSDAVDLLLVMETKVTAAQGTIPETQTDSLVAYNVLTGTRLWAVDAPAARNQVSSTSKAKAGCTIGAKNLTTATSSRGHALHRFATGAPHIVDLVTGAHRVLTDMDAVLGDWIAHPVGNSAQYADAPHHVDLLAPGDGATAGTITDQRAAAMAAKAQSGATTSDGKTFVRNDFNEGLAAFSLPSGAKLWQAERAAASFLYVAKDSNVIITGTAGSTLAARSLSDGKPLWNLSGIDKLCGHYDGKAYVTANGQFATLDESTGKQLAFDPELKECPVIMAGAMFEQSAAGFVVRKL